MFYPRRWGEFRMQVIAYKVSLLIRYKYTMEFQKNSTVPVLGVVSRPETTHEGRKFLCLIKIFKSGHIIYHWTQNFMLIKKNNDLMGKKIKS